MSGSDSEIGSTTQGGAVLAEEQLARVVNLVENLTASAARSESPASLFEGTIRPLFDCVPFDVALAVTVEQHLDLYIARRLDTAADVSEELIGSARNILQTVIPAAFAEADFVVRHEVTDLAGRGSVTSPRREMHVVLKRDGRNAGFLMLSRRGNEFTRAERNVTEIVAAHASMILDNLRARQRISELAEIDDLTGVANRRRFRRQLADEMERARVYSFPLSLLFIDIDDFKLVNDRYGHVVGDAVLSELCGTMKQTLRSPDSISRYGGDEFVVTMPHTGADGAAAAAARILGSVAGAVVEVEEAVRCTVSIGIAQFAGDVSVDDFVSRADAKLYEAKSRGKNRYML